MLDHILSRNNGVDPVQHVTPTSQCDIDEFFGHDDETAEWVYPKVYNINPIDGTVCIEDE